MATIEELEHLARKYADARAALAERVSVTQEEMEAVRRRKVRGIRLAAAQAREVRDGLLGAVADSRPLFMRRRTMEVAGVRFGFKKAADTIDLPDTDALVEAVREVCPDDFDALIKTEYSPRKKAFQALPLGILQALGGRIVAGGEGVIVQATDDQIDKLVTALLGEDTAAELAEAEA